MTQTDTIATADLIARLERWTENARRNNRAMLDELNDPHVVNPATLAARIQGNLEKIEAWDQVLRVIR